MTKPSEKKEGIKALRVVNGELHSALAHTSPFFNRIYHTDGRWVHARRKAVEKGYGLMIWDGRRGRYLLRTPARYARDWASDYIRPPDEYSIWRVEYFPHDLMDITKASANAIAYKELFNVTTAKFLQVLCEQRNAQPHQYEVTVLVHKIRVLVGVLFPARALMVKKLRLVREA